MFTEMTVLLGLCYYLGIHANKMSKKSFIFYIIMLFLKYIYILLMFLAVKCICFNVCNVIMKGIKNGL